MNSHVSFATAFRYYEEGYTIESVETGRTFHKEEEGEAGFPDNTFDAEEIRGKWIVDGVDASDQYLPGYEGIKVLGARIVIKPTPPEETTESGLIIVPNAAEPKYEGTVVAVGPGARLETGVKMPMEIEPGMRIIYSRLAGVPITTDKGEELLVMNERDVIAIIE